MSNERRSSHGSAECSCGGSEVCPLAAIDDCAFDYRCACFDYKNDFWRSKNCFSAQMYQNFIRRVLKNNDRNSSEECSSPSPPCLSQRCRNDRRVQGRFDYPTRCCKSKVANRNLRGSCNSTSSEDVCSSSESLSSSPRKVAPLVALSVSASISPSAQRQHRLPFQRRSPRDERIGSPA